jgi:hypothetical protein
MERIRTLTSTLVATLLYFTSFGVEAKVLSCEATKGNGRGWIPKAFQIDVSNDRKTANVISPVTDVFGAKPFEKSFLGTSLWSRGKGKSKMGDYYNYQLRLDLDSNDTEAKVVMTMQGYPTLNSIRFDRESYLQFRCSVKASLLSKEKMDTASRLTELPEYENFREIRLVRLGKNPKDGIFLFGYSEKRSFFGLEGSGSGVVFGEYCDVSYSKSGFSDTGNFETVCPSGSAFRGSFVPAKNGKRTSGSGRDNEGIEWQFEFLPRSSAPSELRRRWWLAVGRALDSESKTDAIARTEKERKPTVEVDSKSKPSKPQISAVEPIEVQAEREGIAKPKAKTIEQQQIAHGDTENPSIQIIEATSDDARGVISGIATDDSGIAEIRIDGEVVPFDESGRFFVSTFVPPDGKDLEIVAYDLKGLSSAQTVRLERIKRTQTVSRLAAVNPLVGPKQKPSRDRAALIIGVEKYARAPSADYASGDAQMFADYAREKLGVADNNIKILTDTGASEAEILRALKVWLPKAVKPDATDLYVFYAGHGMPTADGSSAYLVPYDGDIQLLEDTAISRKRFFDEISATKPRSATFFFDNCFSGATRSEELLLASRPLGIKVQETSIPDNYLVFAAGETDQIAGVEPEVKHGRFSYFVFKGLEGEADANQDGKISAGELHKYVRESVGRFSAGAQTPTMLGDAGRWVLQ